MKRLNPFILLIISLLAFSSCKNGQQVSTTDTSDVPSASEPADSLFMSFERTPCFGKCAAFRVKVYTSGYATYEGIQFAPWEGMHSGRVKSAVIDEIAAEAERIGFFEMEEKYDGAVTDIPSMIIKLRTKDRSHKIFARYGTPMELKEFGKYLDNVIEGVNWEKTAQIDER